MTKKKRLLKEPVGIKYMKIRKTKFKVGTKEGMDVREGSVGYSFPFMIHREEGKTLWSVSHIATGYMIRSVPKLKEARRMVEQLKPYKVFLMPTIETWQKALTRFREEEREEYKKMMKIVSGEIK